MKKNQKTLNDWVADRKLTIPPGLKRTKANLVALREADDKAKANVQPTGAFLFQCKVMIDILLLHTHMILLP